MKSKQLTHLKCGSTPTKPTSLYNLEGDPGAAPGNICEMNSPNSTLEVGCFVNIKEECTESNPGLDYGCKSTDCASQPVKSEDEAVLSDGYISEGLFQTNSSSSPINLFPRIKLERMREDDYADQLLHDFKTELSSQSPNIGIHSKSEGNNPNSWDNSLKPCPDFAPERQSAFTERLGCELNTENSLYGPPPKVKAKIEEDNDLADPLHTGIEIKDEEPLKLYECCDQDEIKDVEHSSEDDAHTLPSCMPTSSSFGGFNVIHQPFNELPEKIGENRKRNIHAHETFVQKGTENEHLRTHTGDKPFSCRLCSASFVSRSCLNRHVRTHTGEKPFSCNHCSARFGRKDLLKAHMRMHTGEKPFECSHCSASFRRSSYLWSHVRTHTGEKPFSCNHCSASFAFKQKLQRHMQTHTEKSFSCSHCSTSFVKRSDLSRHMRTHTDPKPFSCSHCSAYFTLKHKLQQHIRTHTGEKPFSCNHCSASFTRKHKLQQHIRTHTGEKPFSCSQCSACFTKNVNLNRHMRIHTRERPFSCSQCSTCFAQKVNLNRHMRAHTGEKPFSCNHCSASFLTRSLLTRHIRTHTGEKLFSCNHCSACFAKKINLNRHMCTHSGEQVLEPEPENR